MKNFDLVVKSMHKTPKTIFLIIIFGFLKKILLINVKKIEIFYQN